MREFHNHDCKIRLWSILRIVNCSWTSGYVLISINPHLFDNDTPLIQVHGVGFCVYRDSMARKLGNEHC